MGKKTQAKTSRKVDTVRDDDVDFDTGEKASEDFRWLENALKDKERSRIQRQMKARRELERRQDEKRLKAQIDEDWLMESAH